MSKNDIIGGCFMLAPVIASLAVVGYHDPGAAFALFLAILSIAFFSLGVIFVFKEED